MPAQKLISYDKWKKGTNRAFLPRSNNLKSVDKALKKYTEACERMTTDAASKSPYHQDVSRAFNTWKASKGSGNAWKNTRRDGEKLFTLLDNQLNGIGDTDSALGVADFMSEDMVHARLGALYLFSHMECDDSMFSVALEGTLNIATASLDYGNVDYDSGKLADAGKVVDLIGSKAEAAILAREGRGSKISSNQLLQGVQPPMSARLSQLWETIRNKVLEYASKIIEAIRTKLDEIKDKINTIRANPGDAIMDKLPTILRKLVDALTSRFLADAVPFIGAGIEIVNGIISTFDAGVTKFKEWLAGKEVLLASGHITVIVESIKRAMSMSIGAGLYETLKGGISMGSQFMTAGAAAIVSLVSSIIEAVVKTVWKMIEIGRLRSFFKQAQSHWESKSRADAIHKQPIAFNQWFKGYSLTLPVLPVLALNTGITGNKMLFLQMFKSDMSVVSQSQFDTGVTYLDGLKSWGSDYIEDCGFSFSSPDPTVSGLLAMAKAQAVPLSKNEKIYSGVKKFLSA